MLSSAKGALQVGRDVTQGRRAGPHFLTDLVRLGIQQANRQFLYPMAQHLLGDGVPSDWQETVIAVQMVRAGKMGSTRPLWPGFSNPLTSRNWDLVLSSPITWNAASRVQWESSEDNLRAIAAQEDTLSWGVMRVGFDLIGFHFAHAYPAAFFLTPRSIRQHKATVCRLVTQLRFRSIIAAQLYAAMPHAMPVAAQILCSYSIVGSFVSDEAVQRRTEPPGTERDPIFAFSGRTDSHSHPPTGSRWQLLFGRQNREQAPIPVMAAETTASPTRRSRRSPTGRRISPRWGARRSSTHAGHGGGSMPLARLYRPFPCLHGGHFVRRHVPEFQQPQRRQPS